MPLAERRRSLFAWPKRQWKTLRTTDVIERLNESSADA